MKYILTVMLLAFSLSASASSYNAAVPGWSDLTETQKAEFKLQAAKAAEAKSQVPVSAVEVQEWVNVGKSIGVGFGAAAKEIGVGVDELMKSDTGKITMFLIVWYYIGDQMLGVIGGTLWFLIMIPLWFKWFRKLGIEKSTIYGKDEKILEVSYEPANQDIIIYFSLVAIAIMIIGFVLIFA